MPPPPRRRPGSSDGSRKPSGKPSGRPSGKPSAKASGKPSSGGRGDRREPPRRGDGDRDGDRGAVRGRSGGKGRTERTSDRSSRSGRSETDFERNERNAKERAERKRIPPPTGRGGRWGGLARRAAGAGGTNAPQGPVRGRMADAGPSRAAEAFEAARRPDAGAADPDRHVPDEILSVHMEVVEQDVRRSARKAVKRATVPTSEAATDRRPRKASAALTEALTAEVGAASAPKLAVRLADASRAFEAERFLDAKRILTGLLKAAPGSAAVHELAGLTHYRLGKWTAAAKELETFRSLTGSTEQHPVLADCYRAMRRYVEVESLWTELREVSPSAELVAEGRIVYAGSLADRGQIEAAIAEIEPATRRIKMPRYHHLRLLYVLGDLYERAGDVPRARQLFDRVLSVDPSFGDAAARRRQI